MAHDPDAPGDRLPIDADSLEIAPSKGEGLPDALQAAALQMISSARMFLDIAERAVHDPQVVGQVAGALVGIAKGVLGAFSMLSGAAGATPPEDPPIEHIDVG